MALIHPFGQRIGNPRTNPDHRRLFDAELYGNRVGGLETNATNIAREPVRVLGHDLDGVRAIGLEDPHRSRGADAVAVQKDHDFPHGLLFGPSRENASRANRPDTVDLAQPIRCGLYDFEHILTKGANEFFGVDRSHAPDHAGRKVFFDAVGRSWRQCAQEPRLELLAMGAVVNPFARGRDPLAGGNGCGIANHGHDVTMPARPGAQNAKTILDVVVGYSLDETRQYFLGRRLRLQTHADYPVSLSTIKCSFGMPGGKRLFPKLSDLLRVKSHLV